MCRWFGGGGGGLVGSVEVTEEKGEEEGGLCVWSVYLDKYHDCQVLKISSARASWKHTFEYYIESQREA